MGHLRIRKYRDNRFKRIIVPRWNCHTEYSDEEKHHDFVLLRFPIVFLIATLLLFALLSNNTSAAEEYALHIFPVISVIISSIANLFPISLTEVAVVGLVFTAPILIAIAIYHLIYYIRQKLVKIFLVHLGIGVAWIAFVGVLLFTLLHGINYYREPLRERLPMGTNEYTLEELEEVYAWTVNGINQARSELPEDEDGYPVFENGKYDILDDYASEYEQAAQTIPELGRTACDAKPVALSHLWSYTGITGMYNPFFVEANINMDVPDTVIASTVFHELAHTCGMAKEGDAELASLLVCLLSEDAMARYVGYSNARQQIVFAIQECGGIDAYKSISEKYPVCEEYYTDMAQEALYWEQFEESAPIIEDISTSVNDTYLKLNGQEDGIDSYNIVFDCAVADFYFYYEAQR
ncbi:MAG TPA: DUF3810 domain-containing protein [Bacillota bacterium]|nr:DUF3810 domain-containing protein [Bacillota bacterium]